GGARRGLGVAGGPAAAECAVQRDPGGDTLALQVDQCALRGDRAAACVLELEQARDAALVARLGGPVRALEALGRDPRVLVAGRRAVQRDQRALDLAHRAAQA